MTRRLFKTEGLNPRRVTARDLLGLLHPGSWEALYLVVIVVGGFAAAAYVVASWLVHFAMLGQWWQLAVAAICALAISVGAWLRIPLAALLVAVAIGLGSTALTGGFSVLLP